MGQGKYLQAVHTTTINMRLETPMARHNTEVHHKGEQKCLGNQSSVMFKRGGILG
jgi:hypothetical protein